MSIRILITGGAGFIGSNLAWHHLKQGEKVIIYDNLSRPKVRKNLEWLKGHPNASNLEIMVEDLRNFEALQTVVESVDVIFHLAAQVAVTTSVINPRGDFETNALGTLNVLEASRLSSKNHIIIYSSTNKIYGEMKGVKVKDTNNKYEYEDFTCGISETFPLDFYSPYGCSKGTGDQYAIDYARIYGLETVVFRQSCVYGIRQFGNEDQGWVAHFVISAFFDRPIIIYGDGKQVRDLLYITDLIKAYEIAINNIDVTKGKVYNIGGGSGNSICLLHLIEILEKLLGKKIKYSFAQWRPGDQKVFISDIRCAYNDFGWKPQVSVKEGVNHLLHWVKANKELFL